MQVHALLRRSRLHEAACSRGHRRANARGGRYRQRRDPRAGSQPPRRTSSPNSRGAACHSRPPTSIRWASGRSCSTCLRSRAPSRIPPTGRPGWPCCAHRGAASRSEQLHALCGDERDATLPELLRDPARRARLEPRRACEARQGLAGAARGAWRAEAFRPARHRRARLARTRRPGDGIDGAGTRRGSGIPRRHSPRLDRRASGLVDLAKLAEALEELYAPSRPDKSIRVELLTVHKAKGLQFDTVIVPGLERRSRPDDKRLLQWMRQPGAPQPRTRRGTGCRNRARSRMPCINGSRASKPKSCAQEKRRLLYVAATRAERWLHLFGTCQVKAQQDGGSDAGTSAVVALRWACCGPSSSRNLPARLAISGRHRGRGMRPTSSRDPPLRRLPLALAGA